MYEMKDKMIMMLFIALYLFFDVSTLRWQCTLQHSETCVEKSKIQSDGGRTIHGLEEVFSGTWRCSRIDDIGQVT